jgi:glycine/D-amino acid oxidase-like deaminating enzyme
VIRSGRDRPRVVIVGAGVMGLSCAVEMASLSNLDVTVIDSGYPGEGSTTRSVGVYTRQYLTRRDIELRARGVEELYKLEAEGRLTIRRIGYVRLGRDPRARSLFEQSIELQRELGVDDEGRIIDVEELRRLIPDFDASGGDCCLYCPTEGYLDGAELCGALGEKAQGLGARILVRAGLRSARRGGRFPFELSTDRGVVEADLVVNCAGAWGREGWRSSGRTTRDGE